MLDTRMEVDILATVWPVMRPQFATDVAFRRAWALRSAG